MKTKICYCLLFLVILGGARTVAAAQTKTPESETKFGFLEKLERAASDYRIKIDYAEMFEGDAAERAARQDGEPSPGDGSGIYIRNKNAKIHTETVAPDAVVIVLKNLEPHRLTLAEFARLLDGKTAKAGDFWGFSLYAAGEEKMPCRVTLKNGVIVKIEQVYLP